MKDTTPPTSLKLLGHVGFDTLPNQLVNKVVSNGFVFNIMCLGETGLGKSTLMNSMFERDFHFEPSNHNLSDVSLETKSVDLQENNIRLKLTIVESRGFGDLINKTNSIANVVTFLDAQYEKYLEQEMRIRRDFEKFCDSRIHLCLYFLSPNCHSLKSSDLVALRELHEKVNIIPIISKADTATKSELTHLKQQINEELLANNIKIYRFPTDIEEIAKINGEGNSMMPFAVVGSNEEKLMNGKMERVREYSWGTVQVSNRNHSDFSKLRHLVLATNLEHLRETTHLQHFETYRRRRLLEMGFVDDDKLSLEEVYEKRRGNLKVEMKRKEEEMRENFVQRVKEKEVEIKEAERKLTEHFERSKAEQAEERRKLEERRREFEEQSAAFERRKQMLEHAKQSQFATLSKKSKK